ncbi:MAG: hypothetical protein KTR25_06030 [Myxococcales bacterium]|nr:hypothetical protein [Myxococcales bacterium]
MTVALPIESPSDAPSTQAVEQALNFLAALFMAIRTGQIHRPNNRAFKNSTNILYRSADTLFKITGSFSIQFVDDAAFFNGHRLRFTSGTYATLRVLRQLFECKGLGGISIRRHPSPDAVRQLVLLISNPQPPGCPSSVNFPDDDIALLGTQYFADRTSAVHIDRKVFAVQSYAKLILAIREYQQAPDSPDPQPVSPRRRAIRIIQNLIDLCDDRADFVLRLATNRNGGDKRELASANACVLALAAGYIAGFDRRSVMDLGFAALTYRLDIRPTQPSTYCPSAEAINKIVGERPLNRASYTRLLMLRECSPSATSPLTNTHPFARLLAVIIAYNNLTMEQGWHPLDALAQLTHQPHRFDHRFVDLLINILRAFPVGVRVVLSDGTLGTVHSHDGSSRWDRPVVRIERTRLGPASSTLNLDLMVKHNYQFQQRIVGTQMFVSQAQVVSPRVQHKASPSHLDADPAEGNSSRVSREPPATTQSVAPLTPSIPIHDLQLVS